MHPRCLRCASLKYSRYSRSSRLVSGAPRRPRCDAGFSPRAAKLPAEASMRTWRAAIVLALVGGSIAAPSPSGAQPIVVKAARLIDGRGGPPLEPAMVRITGERIAEVAA